MSLTGINDVNGVDCSDGTDNTLSTNSAEHKRTHLGMAYRANNLYSILNAGTAYLQFKTGAKTTHLKQLGIVVDLNTIVVSPIEAPVITNGTTVVTPYNANRTSSNTSVATLFSNPSGISAGTTIDADLIPAATGGNREPGIMSPADVEWMLKPNTNYVIQMTNQGSTTSQVSMKLLWYEQ
jgi:hypothetical protein